ILHLTIGLGAFDRQKIPNFGGNFEFLAAKLSERSFGFKGPLREHPAKTLNLQKRRMILEKPLAFDMFETVREKSKRSFVIFGRHLAQVSRDVQKRNRNILACEFNR